MTWLFGSIVALVISVVLAAYLSNKGLFHTVEKNYRTSKETVTIDESIVFTYCMASAFIMVLWPVALVAGLVLGVTVVPLYFLFMRVKKWTS
jgi:uncharacterized protein YneF (UPF0154 family)